MFQSLLVFDTVWTVYFFHTLKVIEYHCIGYNIFFGILQ